MKLVIYIILLLISFSVSSARLLPTPQIQDDKAINISDDDDQGSSTELQDDFFQLMGLDNKCNENDDQDCVNRRMDAEAHLDYIYTQHHKPRPSASASP